MNEHDKKHNFWSVANKNLHKVCCGFALLSPARFLNLFTIWLQHDYGDYNTLLAGNTPVDNTHPLPCNSLTGYMLHVCVHTYINIYTYRGVYIYIYMNLMYPFYHVANDYAELSYPFSWFIVHLQYCWFILKPASSHMLVLNKKTAGYGS